MVACNENGSSSPLAAPPPKGWHPLRVRYLLDVALVLRRQSWLDTWRGLADCMDEEIDGAFEDLLALVEKVRGRCPWEEARRLRNRVHNAWRIFRHGAIHDADLAGARYEAMIACNWLAREVNTLRPWYWAVRPLQGLWKPTLMVYDGRQRPRHQVDPRCVIVAGDRYHVVDDHGMVRHGMFWFNPTAIPKRIETIPFDGHHLLSTDRGIYEMDHKGLQGLRLCFAPPHRPRPNQFSAPVGSEGWLTEDVPGPPLRYEDE